jgi:hypothetical protein
MTGLYRDELKAQTSRRRLAMTRQAAAEISIPMLPRVLSCLALAVALQIRLINFFWRNKPVMFFGTDINALEACSNN